MKFKIYTLILIVAIVHGLVSCTHKTQNPAKSNASWIIHPELLGVDKSNQWLCFSRQFKAENTGLTSLKIAADTKYWLWINDSLVVREGGLKWGPVPNGYYVDTLDIGPFLQRGRNEMKVLCWFFGKDGFSHRNSGQAGIWIECPELGLVSDSSWHTAIHPGFVETTMAPHPNWRLAESNIKFDARKVNGLVRADETLYGCEMKDVVNAVEFDRDMYGPPELRPIPFWKDFGLSQYSEAPVFPLVSNGDPIILNLPHNAQVTPYFEIESAQDQTIDIRTDNYKGGSEFNVRTEYISREGRQVFETPGWMNGHSVIYTFPAGVMILDLQYRETGYDTEFSGKFSCSDPFYDTLWQKAQRTLYITMRDNYMDCPDRERAQWWGDVVLELGETFYALDRNSDLLTRKAILELMNWQKPDSTIYSPVPSGNWYKELPTQMLASVGYYGIWTYFQHSGDTAILREVYPEVQDYLAVWKQDSSGLVIEREGGWTWGDWGKHKDMPILFNGWYYLALKGAHRMALVLNEPDDAKELKDRMLRLKIGFNKNYWIGNAYRSPTHRGPSDERGQSLAVISGIAPNEYYPYIKELFKSDWYCSPYMEKYVLEALFVMGYPQDALSRMKERFSGMVKSPITTLWEGWELNTGTWGGGTYNHAWSGGGLTLLSQYVAGIEPLEAGYRSVRIRPQMGHLTFVETELETALGLLKVRVENTDNEIKVYYTAPPMMQVFVETGD